MNFAIYTSTIRQLFSQPVRTGALLGAALMPLLQAAFDPDPRLEDAMWSMWTAVIAAAGIIGLEISTGSLSLYFTRPITRAAYVVSRWCGAVSVAVGMMALGLACESAIVALRDGEISGAAIALAFADRFFALVGIVSVMVCFSALASSLGDLVIWAGLHILAVSCTIASQFVSFAWLREVARVLRGIANPALDLHRIFAASRVPWAELTGYAATLALAAAIAIFAMNRKELSYASE